MILAKITKELMVLTMLFTSGCAGFNTIDLGEEYVQVSSNMKISVNDKRPSGKTSSGKTRVFATASDILVGGLYVNETKLSLEDYLIRSIKKECNKIQCEKNNVFNDSKFSITIDELDMKILAGAFEHEVFGHLSTTVEITDPSGKTSKQSFRTQSEGKSSSSRYPGIMTDLLRIVLNDYSVSFFRDIKLK
jgi:hypothetical protein